MGYAAWSVVFGEQPSAAKWNILGTNDSSFNDGTGISSLEIGSGHTSVKNDYKFSVYRNAAANSGNGAFALVTFDTKIFDTGSNYNTSTGLFTAPVAGFYIFIWFLQTSQNSGSHNWQANLTKNGSGTTIGTGSAGYSGNSSNVTVGASLVQLAANDTTQIMLYGDATLAINVGSSTANFQGALFCQT